MYYNNPYQSQQCGCPSCSQQSYYPSYNYYGGKNNNFALVLVLFILLVIISVCGHC